MRPRNATTDDTRYDSACKKRSETARKLTDLVGAPILDLKNTTVQYWPEASSIMRVLAERSLIGTYLYS